MSSPDGVSSPLYAWRVPPGWSLYYAPLTGSTNDDAMQAARAGCPDRTIFVADAQRAGRGRQGRSWVAPSGSSLLCSVVLRVPLTPVLATGAAALAVVEAVRRMTGLEARVKWPNDVMLGDRKVCGILSEVVATVPPATVVGIGLNVNLDPVAAGLPATTTSLSAVAGAPLPRERLLYAILEQLDATLATAVLDGGRDVLRRWEALLWRRQQQVRLAGDGRSVEGIVEGLSGSGALRLLLPDGSRVDVLAGDLQPPSTG
ncbi:MAG: BirA family transcriptional regulator [Chloroflexota bacterium]|jgi:BirA family biotin operon repressor/biotin-[acetyl-CoA-carboxylase] ligase|nr:BirA family transcriptional regulator [Chloroflexota bacterium]